MGKGARTPSPKVMRLKKDVVSSFPLSPCFSYSPGLTLHSSPPPAHNSNPALEFVAAPALAPPEVQVDEALMEKYRGELDAAAAAPLPDEEDTDI